jgi:AraC-like DNA-binding protein
VPRTRLLGHAAGGVTWQLAVRTPAPALAGVVVGDYLGYDESSQTPVHRRQFAIPGAVLIIELGPPLRLYSDADPNIITHRSGFLATPGEHATLTDHDGRSRGIEVRLTPIGAHLLLLNAPMAEFAGKLVALDDILRDLGERLQNTADWDARFDLLDRTLVERLGRARPATPEVHHALARITTTGGAVDIASLAAELGHSHKSLIHHFNTQIGLSPKRFARLVRFDRVVGHLRGGTGGSCTWADLAARFGYYDQSHLVRDFRQFTGLTPTAARAGLTPWLPT